MVRARPLPGAAAPSASLSSEASMDDSPTSAGTIRDGGQGRNRTGVDGFAGRCMTTLPPGHPPPVLKTRKPRCVRRPGLSAFGAGNETRTRDPDLGKVVLYQLSYSRKMAR